MRRREFICFAGLSIAFRSHISLAQTPSHLPLIAVVIGASQSASERWLNGLPRGLSELGHIEGRDYSIQYRFADGDLTRQPAIIEEVIRLNPNVIVAGNGQAAVQAKQFTSTPIVVALTFDPIGIGLAETYARPNGSVTGIFVDYITLIGKQLELGFEVMSGNKRAGMLVNINDTTPIINRLRKQVGTAADAIGATLDVFDIRVPTDIEVAFESMARIPASFGIVPPNPMFLNQRLRIAELAIRNRMPVVYGLREHVEDGGLMSYGIDVRENFRHVAKYVDKILKGDKPGDLPFEQPTKFELLVNLKAAKAIGVTIPEGFLLRADEVIE